MKTQEAAQFDFWNSFGLPAYPTTAVPKEPELPYLTYQAASAYFGDISNVTVQLWMWSELESEPNRIARQIAEAIGPGGVQLPCEGGTLWIQRGSPWLVPAAAQDENNLKLRQLNVTIRHHVLR